MYKARVLSMGKKANAKMRFSVYKPGAYRRKTPVLALSTKYLCVLNVVLLQQGVSGRLSSVLWAMCSTLAAPSHLSPKLYLPGTCLQSLSVLGLCVGFHTTANVGNNQL